MSDSLLDRLRSLGVKAASEIAPTTEKKSVKISEVIPGRYTENSNGIFFLFERQYEPNYSHGKETLLTPLNLSKIAAYSKINIPAKEDLLFLDTETSGLSGGTGTFAFLIGLSWWENGSLYTQQLFLENPAQEPAALLHLSNLLDRFSTIVSFNGKSFDIPILANRFTLNRMENPLKGKSHIDLLHLSRRLWKERLYDRSLGNLEKLILSFQRTSDDIPGWMVPEMYFEYLRSTDASKLAGVFYHNEIDVVSLAALLIRLDKLLEYETQDENLDTRDLFSIARIMEAIGDPSQALELYDRCLAANLIEDKYRIESAVRSSKISEGIGDLQKAVHYLQSNAQLNNVFVLRRIAILYEHRIKDYRNALYWADEVMRLLLEQDRSETELGHETTRRIERLNAKIKRES